MPASMDIDHSDSRALQKKSDILVSEGDQLAPQAKYHVRQVEQTELQGGQQSVTQYGHVPDQQHHIQSSQGGLGGDTPVGFQPQLRNAHIGQLQQSNSLHDLGPLKLEQTQDEVETGVGSVKREYQLQPQNSPTRSTIGPEHDLGVCAQRLSQYMSQQKNRPNNNSIDFWNTFVAEFFNPDAKKRWCLSSYQNSGEECGAFNQDLWNCELCNCKPGLGFETTFEALPRLFKMKYDSGTLEELLSVDIPTRYHKRSGHLIVEYAKATQESVSKQLRIARDGHLRVVFSPDLKIRLWEFCARSHEVLIPRRSVMPEVSKLEATARNYQSCALSACCNESVQDLELHCDMFVESACQLQKALEVPTLLTKIGYMQNFGRCLQLSDTFCRMKGLIDYSQKTGKGPIESFNILKHGLGNSAQKPEEQQQNIGRSVSGDQLANLSRSCGGMVPTDKAVDEFLDKFLKNSPLENQILNNPCTSAKFVDEFLHKLLKDCPLENQTMNNPSSSHCGRNPSMAIGSSSKNRSQVYKGEVKLPAQTQPLPPIPSSQLDQIGKIKRKAEESPSGQGDADMAELT